MGVSGGEEEALAVVNSAFLLAFRSTACRSAAAGHRGRVVKKQLLRLLDNTTAAQIQLPFVCDEVSEKKRSAD